MHLRHRPFKRSICVLLMALATLIVSVSNAGAASNMTSSGGVSHAVYTQLLQRNGIPVLGRPIPVSFTCAHAGVIKNSDGSYQFSWLHVDSRTGYIMDENNCIVDLHGFNTVGTEFGDGVGLFTSQKLAWFNSMFKMNFVRLNINVGWWNSNVYVPRAGMDYRTWIQQWVTWAEQNGDYVVLNRTNEYQLPPCGGAITYCPTQGEPSDIDDQANLQPRFDSGHLLDQTLVFWNSLASLYKGNPAVLYDAWNELHDLTPASWRTLNVELINAIRAVSPRSLIIIGGSNWGNTMSPVDNGKVPDLNYSNLVYDFHIYDGQTGVSNGQSCTEPYNWMWQHWGAMSDREFAFALSHGHGVIINEWGGCFDTPAYNNVLASYAVSHHISMAYYGPGNVVNGSWTALNNNGLLAQVAYAKFPG